MSRKLPARFTVERASEPLSAQRFLSTNDAGRKCWADQPDHYETDAAAQDMLDQRLGVNADDAVIVRHTVQ